MPDFIDKELMLRSLKSHYGFKKDIDFASFLGIKPTTLSSWYDRKTFDNELIYAKCDKLNPEWLLTGKGEMIRDTSPEATSLINANVFTVRLVSQYAYAGYLGGYGDEEYIDTLPVVPFVIPDGQTTRGQYMAFEVRGDSMDDDTRNSILEGDLALGRHIQSHLYVDTQLHYKKWNSFVIVHKTDGIVIKQITEHNLENKTLTLHSLNPMYKDKVVALADIDQIFNVVQILRKTK